MSVTSFVATALILATTAVSGYCLGEQCSRAASVWTLHAYADVPVMSDGSTQNVTLWRVYRSQKACESDVGGFIKAFRGVEPSVPLNLGEPVPCVKTEVRP
jgi:hypothetical protein